MNLLDRLSERLLGKGAAVDRNRRRLLTALVLGGGAFVATKALSGTIDFVSGDRVINEHVFENFIVRETGKVLSFIDRTSGESILIIDK